MARDDILRAFLQMKRRIPKIEGMSCLQGVAALYWENFTS